MPADPGSSGQTPLWSPTGLSADAAPTQGPTGRPLPAPFARLPAPPLRIGAIGALLPCSTRRPDPVRQSRGRVSMPGKTQAELFITTLEDMLEVDREIRRLQRIRRNRLIAKRYVQAFPADHDDNLEQLDLMAPAGGMPSRHTG